MALVSPGVEVTIIDQSQYLSAAPSSVPLVVLATAQNKTNASGTGIAPGTTAANANKLYAVTSQRDLVTLFGNPFFYKTTNGTPLQGYELNEYGLLAAYSVLGTTNLCYVIRADIDLAALVGRTGRPSGAPLDGTYWLDSASSTWGIFEFNASTGNFTSQTPLVFNDAADLADATGTPKASLGNIGQYAITFVADNNGYVIAGEPDATHTYWYKTSANEWVDLGGAQWRESIPTLIGTATPTTLSSGSIVIDNVTVAVPLAPNNTIDGLVGAINAANIPFTSAAKVNGRIQLYTASTTLVIGSGSTTAVLTDLGLTVGTFYGPQTVYATNAQQPLWRSTDAQPHPTGSVWIKTNAANRGIDLVVSQYSAATATFASRNVPVYNSDGAATAALDATGGQNIPIGTLYGRVDFQGSTSSAPVQIYRRAATGPTVVVGTLTSPTFTNGTSFEVYVSEANTATPSGPYTVTLPSTGTLDASDWVQAWTAAAIPNTTAEVSTTGAIVLTHTLGGQISMLDFGVTPSAVTEAGFINGTTPGCKWGNYQSVTFTGVTATGGTGTAATFNVVTAAYNVAFTVSAPGSGYAVNDILTVTGANPYLPYASAYTLKVTAIDGAGGITGVVRVNGLATPSYSVELSNWYPLAYIANPISPTQYPTTGTNWYYSVINQVDIMTNVGGQWRGYRNVNFASNGLPQATGTPSTDPNGPQILATAPTTQSDGTPLVFGDLWINSSDLENYPVINRWQEVNGVAQWVTIDNTDNTSENGIVFADARWAPNGTTDPIYDPIPSITSLLTSNYLDLDAPSGALYPQGTLLFNTRRSGYNVKQFRQDYFNATSFPDETLPQETSAWVTVSGNMTDGAPYMGRKAQRAMVVAALRSTLDTSAQLRDEDTFLNLMATPNYPECQPNMVTLNNDRGQTAYIIGDTPLRLADNAQDIIGWATNAAGASSTGEEGLVTRNTYMGLYYPSGITTDLQGSEVVIPSSHMILRTMIYNDTVAYPWFAPAGQLRGIVDNATSIGYLSSTTGEFVPTKNRQQLRDVEYTNFINPIAQFQNLGILNYGNKNSFDSQSALDRTNVARLVVYLRYQLTRALRPFIFEPNDNITRNGARAVVESLLADIQAKRGIYDYLVVCDDSNNTPARIDRNELWIDVAIEPTKAVEFIYVPVRLLNTGEIAGLIQNG